MVSDKIKKNLIGTTKTQKKTANCVNSQNPHKFDIFELIPRTIKKSNLFNITFSAQYIFISIFMCPLCSLLAVSVYYQTPTFHNAKQYYRNAES